MAVYPSRRFITFSKMDACSSPAGMSRKQTHLKFNFSACERSPQGKRNGRVKQQIDNLEKHLLSKLLQVSGDISILLGGEDLSRVRNSASKQAPGNTSVRDMRWGMKCRASGSLSLGAID